MCNKDQQRPFFASIDLSFILLMPYYHTSFFLNIPISAAGNQTGPVDLVQCRRPVGL